MGALTAVSVAALLLLPFLLQPDGARARTTSLAVMPHAECLLEIDGGDPVLIPSDPGAVIDGTFDAPTGSSSIRIERSSAVRVDLTLSGQRSTAPDIRVECRAHTLLSVVARVHDHLVELVAAARTRGAAAR